MFSRFRCRYIPCILVVVLGFFGSCWSKVLWADQGLPESLKLRADRNYAGSRRVKDKLKVNVRGHGWDEHGHFESPWLLHVKGGDNAKVLEKVAQKLGTRPKYIPHHSILAISTLAKIDEARKQLPEIMWAAPLQPHHKVDPELYPLLLEPVTNDYKNTSSARRKLLSKDGGVDLSVLMAKGYGGVEVAKQWTAHLSYLGFSQTSVRAASQSKIIVSTDLETSSEIITWLSQQSDTVWVEKRPRFKLLNKWAKGVMQSGSARHTPLWDRGLKGQGEVLGIADTGISMNLCYFWDTQTAVPYNSYNPNHRKIVKYKFHPGYGSNRDEEGHGTHTSGSLAGDAPDGTPNAEFNGMAPKAKIFFDDIYANGELSPPDDLENDLFPEPYSHGAKIRSESWGGDSIFYTSSAMEADSFTFHHRDFLVVWAAGNEGELGMFTIGSPATGKNMLAVGAQHSTAASLELQNSDTHFFELAGPSRKVPVEGVWASFGSKNPFQGPIVQAFPADACTPLTNGAFLEGKIALVVRGSCNFVDKAQMVQNAKAIAMIVADNTYTSTVVMGGSGRAISIPCMSISRHDGDVLIGMLGEGETRLVWESTGPDVSVFLNKCVVPCTFCIVNTRVNNAADTISIVYVNHPNVCVRVYPKHVCARLCVSLCMWMHPCACIHLFGYVHTRMKQACVCECVCLCVGV
jgi:hypothetical protein